MRVLIFCVFFFCLFRGFHSMEMVDLCEGENVNGKFAPNTTNRVRRMRFKFAYFNSNILRLAALLMLLFSFALFLISWI